MAGTVRLVGHAEWRFGRFLALAMEGGVYIFGININNGLLDGTVPTSDARVSIHRKELRGPAFSPQARALTGCNSGSSPETDPSSSPEPDQLASPEPDPLSSPELGGSGDEGEGNGVGGGGEGEGDGVGGGGEGSWHAMQLFLQ